MSVDDLSLTMLVMWGIGFYSGLLWRDGAKNRAELWKLVRRKVK